MGGVKGTGVPRETPQGVGFFLYPEDVFFILVVGGGRWGVSKFFGLQSSL